MSVRSNLATALRNGAGRSEAIGLLLRKRSAGGVVIRTMPPITKGHHAGARSLAAWIDGTPLQVAGLHAVLTSFRPEIQVYAVVRTPASMFDVLREQPADLAILSVTHTDARLLDVTTELRRRFRAMRILVLVETLKATSVERLLRMDVRGILTYQTSVESLRSALRVIGEGDFVLDPFALEAMNGEPRLKSTLTDRQRAVLSLLSEGLSNDEIAHHLSVSLSTLKRDLTAIRLRIGVRNRAELIAYAVTGLSGGN